MQENKIGDYELLGSLGRGGFGNVYKAKTIDGDIVALKRLNPHLLDNPDIVRRFLNEANILSKLKHSNICRLIEFFPDGPDYTIVLEHIDGMDLKKMMQKHPDNMIPFERAIKIAGECISAFQYAYENGILHRDIKPSNIMIAKNGQSKITDFGTAVTEWEEAALDANGMMSASYSAPERFSTEKNIDVRSDIYSLGIVFYELFTGKLPFDAIDVSEIISWHVNNTPLPADFYNPCLPPEITCAIKTSLEKKPENRFKDFSELKKAMMPEL